MRTSLAFAILLVGSSCLRGALLELNWTNSDYFSKDQLDTARQFAQIYQHVEASGDDLAGGALSFHSSLQTTNLHYRTGLRTTDLLQGYLQWSNRADRADLRLGRMSIYDSPLPLHYDGAWGELRTWKFLSVAAAGGISTPSRFDQALFRTPGPQSGIVVLGGVNLVPTRSTIVKLQYLQVLDSGTISDQRVSMSALQEIGGEAEMTADAVYDIHNASLSNFSLTGRVSVGRRVRIHPGLVFDNHWYDTTEAIAKVVSESHYDPRLGFELGLGNSLMVNADYAARLFETHEPLHEIEGSLEHDRFMVGYVQELGYGGNGGTVRAHFIVLRQERFRTALQGSFATWSDSISGGTSPHAWSGSISLDARPFTFMDTYLEFQALGNRLYAFDLRAYLRTRMHISRFFR